MIIIIYVCVSYVLVKGLSCMRDTNKLKTQGKALTVSGLLPHSQHCLLITPCLFTLRFFVQLTPSLPAYNLLVSQFITNYNEC